MRSPAQIVLELEEKELRLAAVYGTVVSVDADWLREALADVIEYAAESSINEYFKLPENVLRKGGGLDGGTEDDRLVYAGRSNYNKSTEDYAKSLRSLASSIRKGELTQGE